MWAAAAIKMPSNCMRASVTCLHACLYYICICTCASYIYGYIYIYLCGYIFIHILLGPYAYLCLYKNVQTCSSVLNSFTQKHADEYPWRPAYMNHKFTDKSNDLCVNAWPPVHKNVHIYILCICVYIYVTFCLCLRLAAHASLQAGPLQRALLFLSWN